MKSTTPNTSALGTSLPTDQEIWDTGLVGQDAIDYFRSIAETLLVEKEKEIATLRARLAIYAVNYLCS